MSTGTAYVFDWVPKSFWDARAVKKYFYPHWSENTSLNYPNNWRLIRYADVLIMFAEADYHVNGGTVSSDGMEAMNQIRRRVGMQEYASVAEITLEVFKKERLREFLYELNPSFHYIRWSMQSSGWVDRLSIEYNSKFIPVKHEYLPIPQTEIDFHGGSLVQNPGY